MHRKPASEVSSWFLQLSITRCEDTVATDTRVRWDEFNLLSLLFLITRTPIFFFAPTAKEAAETVLAGKIPGVIATLPHPAEEEPRQDQQPNALRNSNSPQPEDIRHEPVPEQLNNRP
jgi:hypothetical protein